jgi:aminopeptidase N
VAAFAQGTPTQFNRPDGLGYEFIADKTLTLDPANPQLASRMSTAFKNWRALEAGRRSRTQAALKRIFETPEMSCDVGDIVQRALADS